MWNLISINPICQRKKIVNDQEKLLSKITNTKSRVDTSAPWRPSHSLSKWNNKYAHAEENKIVYENNILLNKMVNIQKQGNKSLISMPQLPKSQQMTKRIQIEKLQQENQQLLDRLQTAQATYSKQFWAPDDQRNQAYKQLHRPKVQQHDYSELARKQLGSRSAARFNEIPDS
ncbi:unnamed protein product [Paramecium sonneborni]|uniref:Uncharacterized protein n=1 Tax=Paramecium sonneborni TaxID=65129 RepID=A0A8S1JWT7_9CILI|nr:unnamed protein product [Paramecium sonneborni]